MELPKIPKSLPKPQTLKLTGKSIAKPKLLESESESEEPLEKTTKGKKINLKKKLLESEEEVPKKTISKKPVSKKPPPSESESEEETSKKSAPKKKPVSKKPLPPHRI